MSRLYAVEAFAVEEMKEPFEIEDIAGDMLVRTSSLDRIVPDFMHGFYKPKKMARYDDEDHIDETQLHSH